MEKMIKTKYGYATPQEAEMDVRLVKGNTQTGLF